jgi:hypothetical protein
LLNLGFQPYSNDFKKIISNEIKFPLEVNLCKICYNAQLTIVPEFKKIYKNYIYKSSVSFDFQNHFDKACKKYIKKFKIKKSELVVDIGSNDGIGLLPFKKRAYNNLIGFEPSTKLANDCKKKGIKIINSFFTKQSILKRLPKSKAKLVLASNVFAHIANPREMLFNIKSILSKNGTIVLEVQYLLNTILDLSFDNIYHEHVNYWCLSSLNYLVKDCNLKIFDMEKIKTHGGSIRVYICDSKKKVNVKKRVIKTLSKEVLFFKKIKKEKNIYSKEVSVVRNNLIQNFILLKKKYAKIIGYGASAKATVLLNFLNIDKNVINFFIDDNDLKLNKFIPGTKIKIFSSNQVKMKNKYCIVVFAWNLFREIKKKYINSKIKILSVRELYKKI